jgi:hypothetical protein
MREVQITGGAGVRVAADEVDFADGNPTRMVQLLKIISGKDGEKYPWQIDQFLRGLVFPDGLRKKMRDEFAGARRRSDEVDGDADRPWRRDRRGLGADADDGRRRLR